MVREPVFVDTDVFSARLIANLLLARRYEPVLTGRYEVISFQTVAELRYGAQLRGWGTTASTGWKPRSRPSKSSTPATS